VAIASFLTVALFLGRSRAAFYSMAKAFLESIEHALLHRVPTMGADWAGVLYEYLSIALGIGPHV
jgi:hypothetical protein